MKPHTPYLHSHTDEHNLSPPALPHTLSGANTGSYLHLNDGLQGLGLGGLRSSFVATVQLLGVETRRNKVSNVSRISDMAGGPVTRDQGVAWVPPAHYLNLVSATLSHTARTIQTCLQSHPTASNCNQNRDIMV